MNYENLLALTRTTLPKFISQSKDGWINDATPRTFLAGRLLRRCKREIGEGLNIRYEVQLQKATAPQWVGPLEKLEIRSTPAPESGSVPWRFLQDRWGKSKQELDLNQGRAVVVKLLQQSKETISTAAVTELEDTLVAQDGNYKSDGQDVNYKKPLGVRYWGTIDGLHITGDTSKDVGGINPTTFTDWKNPFINPVTSSDLGTRGKITHGRQLGPAFERIAARMRFESADVWGKLAENIKHGPRFDPDSAQNPKDLLICTDYETNILHREVIFDSRDNVAKDQYRGRPTWKGVPVDWDEKLGLGANGYGRDADGNDMWTDRTGSYASGLWTDGGEVFFFNTFYLRMSVHKDNDPFIKPPYMPEGMMAMAFEWTFWMNTWIRSRRRGIGYIAGYINDL